MTARWFKLLFLPLSLLNLLSISCSFDFGNVPEGAQITCKSTADCPGSWICNTTIGTCVKEIDPNPPKFAATPELLPLNAKKDTVITLEFESDKELFQAPEVKVKLGTSERVFTPDEARTSGKKYTFTYTAVGDEPVLNECPVLVTMVDKSGNKAENVSAGALHFDFDAPSIKKAELAGSPVKNGGVVKVSFTLDKAITGEPVVKLDGGKVFTKESSSGGLSFVYAYIAGDDDVPNAAQIDTLSTPPYLNPLPPGERKYSSESLTGESPLPLRERPALSKAEGDRVRGEYAAPIEKAVTIEASDEAGNKLVQTLEQKVTFDFQKPALIGDVVIEPESGYVREGVEVRVTFTTNKELGAVPEVSFGDVKLLSVNSGNDYVSNHFAQESKDSPGSKPLSIKLVDKAGNESVLAPGRSLVFDFGKPELTGVKTDKEVYGSTPGFCEIKLTFDCSKNVDGGIKAFIDGIEETWLCGERSDTSPNYTCTFSACNTVSTEGFKTISVEARDKAGNMGSGSTKVEFDFTAPTYLAGTAASQLQSDYPENPVINVSAVTNGTTYALTFSITEELDAASPRPKVVACKIDGCTPADTAQVVDLDLDTSSSTDRTFRFAKKMTGLADNQNFVSKVYILPDAKGGMYDKAGNVQNGVINIAEFAVNTVKPDYPSAANVFYRRVPWGQKDADGKFVEKNFTVVCNACQFATTVEKVLIYDSATPASGGLIGEYQNPHTGGAWGFNKIKLNGSDRAHVWMATADSAGNISPATEVKSAEWVATMGYKVPGSVLENSHSFNGIGIYQQQLGQDLFVTEPEVFSNGVYLAASQAGAQRWVERTPPEDIVFPFARNGHALAYDSARGKVVLFGGRASSIFFNDTWEWDGVNWMKMTPNTSPPVRYCHALAYDNARGKVVLFGGVYGSDKLSDTWEWDGINWTQKRPANSPTARYHHALAYDSARGKTVLFGGYDGSSRLNSTWEWDGENWIEKLPVTKPSSRYSHALAYDGNRERVVLFGGASSTYNETWEWDGVNWTQKFPTNSPPGRYRHALAYDSARGKVVLFGGYYGTNCLNDTWEWDGENWEQKVPASSPPGRYFHALAFDALRKKVVVFGGVNSFGKNLNDTWGWDGGAWTQQVQSKNPPARYYHALAYDSARKKTVLFGGSGGIENDTWEWDGLTWTQKIPVTSPPTRHFHALAYDGARGKTVLFGGADDSSKFNDTWEWDGGNWTQKIPTTTSPPARYGHALAYDSAHGKVVLFGGTDGSSKFDDTWEWDGSDWTQKAPATIPPGRSSHALAYDISSGKTVLFGGSDGTILNDTWEWDGENWTQKVSAVSPPARITHALAYDNARGKTVLFGGDGSSSYFNDTWEWDGSNWAQKSPAARPPGRNKHAVAYDSARGKVVLFSGFDGSHRLDDTWEWNGESWEEKTPSYSPLSRYAYALAYDASREKTVLFGGWNGASGILNDTWEWDGTTWTQKFPGTTPSARFSHALTYDNARKKVLLFGGNHSNTRLSDTWEWDGENWIKKVPTTSPPKREDHALAYDSKRQKVVLFGGYDGSSRLNDTWEWDGVNWNQKAPGISPPVRSNHALAYDSVKERVVLFGGYNGSSKYNDTWEWDGENWTKKEPTDNPSGRSGHALEYDGMRGKVLLFGGYDASKTINDTWEWDGSNWTQQALATNPSIRYGHVLAYDSARGKTVLFGGYGSDDYLNDTWEWDGQGDGKPAQIVEITAQATGVFNDATKPQLHQLTTKFVSGGIGYPQGVVTKGVNLMAWYGDNWHTVASNSDVPTTPGLVEWNTTDEGLIKRLLYGGRMNFNFAVVPQAPNGFGDPDCVDPETNHCDMGQVSTEYMEVTVKYTLP